ncbi:MAG TPA: HD domain-containing protein [Anaerolineae bacterium]|nr:HD domain-containing protein [Anaerolineae bacterium]
MTMVEWEAKFERWLLQLDEGADAAHGLTHIKRVVQNAKVLAENSGADLAIVVPAAWLHDCVSVAKDSPLRSQASRLAAQKAGEFLTEIGYAKELIPAIQHAIEAHSFSAEITPTTLAAQIVQDADRLDSLGAIGVTRCIQTGVAMNRQLYHPTEPFPINRKPDDTLSTIDHFYTKLLTLAGTMQTEVGRVEAQKRTRFMEAYLEQLRREIINN